MFNKRILVLDKNYQPIRIVDLRGAIYLVFREAANVIDADYNVFNLREWITHSEIRISIDSEFKALRSVDSAFGVPDVVILKHFKQKYTRQSICTKKNIGFRDLYICQYCSEKLTRSESTIDHIVPVSKGGKLTWTNVVTSCRDCNNKKGNKDLDKSGLMLSNRPKPLFWDRSYFARYEKRYPNPVWKRFL
jgi:5-methylcytosine-specific restriction endonuclease McrA